MSRSYDEQSNWYYSSTTSPEHDRYVRDHRHHSFHPPPLPPLPSHMGGQAAPLPGPGGGFHQGFAVPPHCDVPTTPAEEGASSFAKDDSKTAARQRRNGGGGDDDDASSSSSLGKSLRPSNFADASSPTPNRHRYYDRPFERHRIMMPIPASSARDDPYYSPRMPSSVQAPPWTVASPEYRGGPYFSGETPSLLGVGSGSSESSTSASSSSSSAAAAGGGGRPVPAKSAFMCFCEAKGAEISNRNEVSTNPFQAVGRVFEVDLGSDHSHPPPPRKRQHYVRRKRVASSRPWQRNGEGCPYKRRHIGRELPRMKRRDSPRRGTPYARLTRVPWLGSCAPRRIR
jgi:hypothetical protein